MTTFESNSLIEQYKSYGDRMPSKTLLTELIDHTRNAKLEPSVELLLATAHAGIDLGIRTRYGRAKSEHLAVANDYLGYAAGIDKEARTAVASPNSAFTLIVSALLQKPELRCWKQAAWRHQIAHAPTTYEAMLEGSRNSMAYIDSNVAAHAKVIEFMPVLLGARGVYKQTGGWLGRMALLREDQGPKTLHKGSNRNWDVGICLPDMDYTFQAPLRIQIKKSLQEKRRTQHEYRRAGVACLAAEQCGFANPEQIVLSCFNEFEQVTPPEDVALLGSDQLDAITHTIATKVRREHQVIQGRIALIEKSLGRPIKSRLR